MTDVGAAGVDLRGIQNESDRERAEDSLLVDDVRLPCSGSERGAEL